MLFLAVGLFTEPVSLLVCVVPGHRPEHARNPNIHIIRQQGFVLQIVYCWAGQKQISSSVCLQCETCLMALLQWGDHDLLQRPIIHVCRCCLGNLLASTQCLHEDAKDLQKLPPSLDRRKLLSLSALLQLHPNDKVHL